MLPQFLQSSYKKYKQDTDIVATWLAAKAQELGYSVDSKDGHNTASTSGRLKGKARKQEKEKSAQSASNPTVQPCYVVKIKDFVPLAEFLAGYTKPIIKVPLALVKALDRAIELRTQHTEYARKSTSRDDKAKQLDADTNHSYFLGVLGRVREVLRPRMTAAMAEGPWLPQHAKRDVAAESLDGKEEEEITNRFQMLDLEEPSQAFLDAPGVSAKPQVQLPVRPSYVAEVDQSLEEKLMASFCLFEDIGEIRAYVRHIWVQYKHCRLDLVSAAITTNTAICLIRDMEDDFVRRFTAPAATTGFRDTVQLLFQLQCCVRGQNPEEPELAGDPMNFKVYDLAEEYLVTTWQLMTELWDTLKPSILTIYQPTDGDRDWQDDWDKMTPREKFREDHWNLMEGLSDLIQLATKGQRPLAEDEIIRGLRDVAGKDENDIPISLVFALRCFLDIQHTMTRAGVGRGYEQLKRTAFAMKASLTETLNLHASLKLPRFPNDTLAAFNTMYGAIETWVVQDNILEQRKKISNDPRILNAEPHALLRHNPLLCGLYEFALKARFQELSISFVNNWKSIVTVSHLYNALRQEKLLGRPWKDMEIAIMFQGCEAFFVGNKPSNLEQYERRFMLRVGISSAAYASNRRTNVDPLRTKKKKGSKLLEGMSPVWKLFAGRYLNNGRSLLLTPQSIKPIIEAKMAKKNMESASGSDPRSTRAKQGPEVAANKSGKAVKSRDDDKRTSASISAVNFLEDIAVALSAEACEFSLDYLDLHRTCWRLLEHVHKRCESALLEIFGPFPGEKFIFLALLPGYIFSSATKRSLIGAVRQRTAKPSNHVFRLAAEAIEEFFKDGGDDRQAKALEEVHGLRVDVDQSADKGMKDLAAEKDVPVAEKDIPLPKKGVANTGDEMAGPVTRKSKVYSYQRSMVNPVYP
ncbi:MAG: hypothetical protein LQ346_008245 [Caloplaca aetnensis]|nr:MAG: hypothetical protein LQ346_008245 [Caloplaca aetnensis]